MLLVEMRWPIVSETAFLLCRMFAFDCCFVMVGPWHGPSFTEYHFETRDSRRNTYKCAHLNSVV